MDMWRCLRDVPGTLITELGLVVKQYGNKQDGYLKARDELNSMILSTRDKWIRRAAMLLYINARCFNGLWRTNDKGYYNVPFGKLENPSSIDLEEAIALSGRLHNAILFTGSYANIITRHEGSLKTAAIYADPPYDATFGDYTKDGFSEIDQRELAEFLRWCVMRGSKVWASNNDTPLVREIYSWAKIEAVYEQHNVGATGDRRGKRACVLIRGGL
jgi:DNA adenine methylase